MSIDKFLSKTYHKQTYNCAHFVCELWKEETGQDLSVFLTGFLSGKSSRKVCREDLKFFHRLNKPVSPCIVLMNPTGNRTPHVGMFLRGRVMHINELGVLCQKLELASIGFKTVRFYTCK